MPQMVSSTILIGLDDKAQLLFIIVIIVGVVTVDVAIINIFNVNMIII